MARAIVKYVYPDSIGEQIGLAPGDCIVKINDSPVEDVLDYKFLSADEVLVIEIQKNDGSTDIVEVETYYEDLGIEFENSLIDKPRACQNKCIFCFIDQLPKGMRKTLYFKDDDARLSFLQGNYITLTNLSDSDVDRIIKYHISPVNVSVHTTDPALREFMLKNKKAGKLFSIMQKLASNEIYMNCQIVLCPGINDGENLNKTILDLSSLYPYVNSVSVVPVGLSAHREGLCNLMPYDGDMSKSVIEQVKNWQTELLCKYGSRIIFLADEFYIMAGEPLPSEEEYEGYCQLENGVGMITSMRTEFDMALKDIKPFSKKRKISIATGEIAYNFICSLVDRLKTVNPELDCTVYAIKNNVFGGRVTVSGLVCASDIIAQLDKQDPGDALYIPISMLRDGDDVFLDDIRLETLEKELGIPVIPVDNDGFEFAEKILDITIETDDLYDF